MSPVPAEASAHSQMLYEITEALALCCPSHLGEEILIIGSVAWGIADADSDIDLEFWVPALPLLKKAMAWLKEAGAVDLNPNTGPDLGVLEIVCRYRGVWPEANWQILKDKEEMLQAILEGEDARRSHLA